VLEVRYVGNKATHQWHYQSVNEVNILENRFLPQFIQAQKNLTINQANGKGNTFANNGLSGQAPIPIFETAFGANGSQPALSASSGFANSTFITNLQQGVAGTMAATLASTSSNTYFCRLVGNNFAPCAAAGFTSPTPYPINFFTPNPYATNLRYQDDNGSNNYNGLQIVATKRTSHGFAGVANFTWSHALGNELNATGQTADYQWFTLRNGRLSYGPSPFDRRFTFSSYWTYDLPLGKRKALNVSNSLLDRIAGGWTIGGVHQIASGAPNLINSGRNTVNTLNTTAGAGLVLSGGLTASQLRNDLATIPDKNLVLPGGNLITNVGSITQSNGIPNPASYGPAATPGVFGALIYLYQRPQFLMNMSLNKQIPIREQLNIGFRLEALNFLNHPFFQLGNTTPTGNNFGQISSTFNASGNPNFNRVVLLRGYVSW
jgi:hypothetical protein